MSNYCAHYDFAMWPLQVLDTLLLGATARLQQYNQLVLAILREIKPLPKPNRTTKSQTGEPKAKSENQEPNRRTKNQIREPKPNRRTKSQTG